MEQLGFIILRHVNNIITNQYWIKCYQCIRSFYPNNKIVIIDDNSHPEFLTTIPLCNCTIIKSEFPRRGELLPYYYYLQNPTWFNTAVIIHDSVFINSYINFETNSCQFLWNFKTHACNKKRLETKMLSLLVVDNVEKNKLLSFYNTKKWQGCFGAMTIITHDFLKKVNEKYALYKLLPIIINRTYRCSFERIIACILLQFDSSVSISKFGDIHQYCPWGIKYKDVASYQHLPIIKVWTGR